ncbi:MAG: hypothetical protein IT204_06075 [Fimbriimonadaceae bacterium]|nr:hypothetical protein [Fimbriimonadaceae bacterium]
MNCVHCGAENPTAGTTCILCGQELARPRTVSRPEPAVVGAAAGVVLGGPPSLIGWSVGLAVGSVLCGGILGCLPLVFSIVAIVYASQANSKGQVGLAEAAWRDYSQAKTWCWVAAGCWILSALATAAYIAFVVVVAINDPSFRP